MEEFIAYIAGVIIGVVVTVVWSRFKATGRLDFYQMEDGEPPVMTAVLYEPVENIRKRKYVLFHISHK